MAGVELVDGPPLGVLDALGDVAVFLGAGNLLDDEIGLRGERDALVDSGGYVVGGHARRALMEAAGLHLPGALVLAHPHIAAGLPQGGGIRRQAGRLRRRDAPEIGHALTSSRKVIGRTVTRGPGRFLPGRAPNRAYTR
jgi:hypothetical protein